MKVIDLLNKIANGEKPIPINYGDNSEECLTYYLYDKCGGEYDDSNLQNILNDEIEIIEEDKKIDKINKINWKSCADNLKEVNGNIDELSKIINEIIDYLEEKE